MPSEQESEMIQGKVGDLGFPGVPLPSASEAEGLVLQNKIDIPCTREDWHPSEARLPSLFPFKFHLEKKKKKNFIWRG